MFNIFIVKHDRYIIIQEDLLKINKNMLKLIQLFTSAWRNKDTERGKRKIRQAVVYTAFTKRKTTLKKTTKNSHTNIYKINTNV